MKMFFFVCCVFVPTQISNLIYDDVDDDAPFSAYIT